MYKLPSSYVATAVRNYKFFGENTEKRKEHKKIYNIIFCAPLRSLCLYV
jgi:hypothetical protein